MADYDIPLAEAQVIWVPVDDPNLPPIEVIGVSIDDDTRYENSWGSCLMDFNEASPAEQIQMLLAQFAYITAVDGISPNEVRRAFYVIPEYRDAISSIGWREKSQGMP